MPRAVRWPRRRLRANPDRKTRARIWLRSHDRLVVRGLLTPRRAPQSNGGAVHGSRSGRRPERTDHVSKSSGQITCQQHYSTARYHRRAFSHLAFPGIPGKRLHRHERPRVVRPVASEGFLRHGPSPPVASVVGLRRGCSRQGWQYQQNQAQERYSRPRANHDAEYTESPWSGQARDRPLRGRSRVGPSTSASTATR